jgi:phage-related minor tail protein
MDRLEPLISKLKHAIAHAEAAEAQRHREAETQRDSIHALVNQLVAMHQASFWRDDSQAAFAQNPSEPISGQTEPSGAGRP